MVADKMVADKMVADKMVADKMVRTNCHWTKWYGQNGSKFWNSLQL